MAIFGTRIYFENEIALPTDKHNLVAQTVNESINLRKGKDKCLQLWQALKRGPYTQVLTAALLLPPPSSLKLFQVCES